MSISISDELYVYRALRLQFDRACAVLEEHIENRTVDYDTWDKWASQPMSAWNIVKNHRSFDAIRADNILLGLYAVADVYADAVADGGSYE